MFDNIFVNILCEILLFKGVSKSGIDLVNFFCVWVLVDINLGRIEIEEIVVKIK